MTDPIDNPQLRLAFEYVQYTGQNVFLTGKAGTGKTTFLHSLKSQLPKRLIVVAPTGVAAINAGGVTIHSFFQLPFGPLVPDREPGEDRPGGHYRFSRQKSDIIRSLDLLVIDEISMVRADLLDGIDEVLRRFRPGDRPFGGVQLLMIGDLQQLAPVAKEEEWELLRDTYETPFFFSSRALGRTRFVSIELKHIYRQRDERFIHLLAKVRENRMEEADFKALNSRCNPALAEKIPEGTITLTTHNFQARQINEARLAALPGRERRFEAQVKGDFPSQAFPTASELLLKPGAQVMFIKNDPSPGKSYFNGKIGRLKAIFEDRLVVECPGDTHPITVEQAEWKNIKYQLNEETKAIEETETGSFIQFPLKLAWAITIHKSQGLTFDHVIIDARSAFADGQVYVALSRCRTLEGVVLSTPIESRSIKSSPVVGEFTHQMEENLPDQDQLKEAKKDFQSVLLDELFDFSSLLRGLFLCLKTTRENQTILVGPTPLFFERIIESVKTEIIGITEKFAIQRRHIAGDADDLEGCALLQERIRKAAEYFGTKIESLVIEPLQALSVETDNREIRKALEKALDTVQSQGIRKRYCLQACRSGIVFADFLRVRALSLFQEVAVKPGGLKKEKGGLTEAVSHPELYAILKQWRSDKAAKEGRPAFWVLHNTTLAEISAGLPATLEELRRIKGVKGTKGKSLGPEILEMVARYREKHHLPISQAIKGDEEAIGKNPKKEKGKSREESLRLFQSGLPLVEVAAARGLALPTIEGHLVHWVGTGDLELKDLMDRGKSDRIAAYFQSHPNQGLSAAKKALGEEVSYGDLRLVLMDLERQGKNKREVSR